MKGKKLAIFLSGSLLLLGGGIFWYVLRPTAVVAPLPGVLSEEAALPFVEEEELTEAEEGEAYPAGEALPAEAVPPVYIDVTAADCNSECEAFAAQPERLAYCQSVCGLSPASSASCDAEAGVSRDICLKEKAIREQDLEGCAGIHDETLRKKCQARVTEDFL